MQNISRKKPLVLIIMDGYGHNPNPEMNAVYHAKKPVLNKLYQTVPHTELLTSGLRVGLPEGQMGNSEVGHLNIGGGRVVEQELTRIDKAVANKTLGQAAELKQLFASPDISQDRALHLVGLVSLGGVHSHLEHLNALINEAAAVGVKNIYVHAITDGRDRPPTAATEEFQGLVDCIESVNSTNSELRDVRLSTICGRFYAMDRDTRWDRTKKGYDLFTTGRGEVFDCPLTALRTRRDAGAQDEFLEPICIAPPPGRRSGLIEDGDAVLFFNFRADRMRQLVRAFFQKDFAEFSREASPKLCRISTITEYDEDFPVHVVYSPASVVNHLGRVLAEANKSQLRIAETEKYAHVTYFFNGGEEEPCPGEERLLISSPRDVPTYDLKPEMSAYEVANALVGKLAENTLDTVILNFANCDMVGHCGFFEAALKAVETVDTCVGTVLKTVDELGGTALITADHGNADQMIDYETGKPHTFHTTHPVPFLLVGDGLSNVHLRGSGALCDIAPTICELMGIKPPPEMTGQSLIVR